MLSIEERNKIVTENTALVHKMLQLLMKSGVVASSIVNDYDDLYQTGVIGLIHAAASYEESKGKFSTYACTCIKNQILLEYRAKLKDKEILNFYFMQCEEDLELNIVEQDTVNKFEDIENTQAICNAAVRIFECHKGNLAKTGLKVVLLEYKGFSIKDAAKMLCIPYTNAKKASQYFKTLLKKEALLF